MKVNNVTQMMKAPNNSRAGMVTNALLTVEIDGEYFHVNFDHKRMAAIVHFAITLTSNGQLPLVRAKAKENPPPEAPESE